MVKNLKKSAKIRNHKLYVISKIRFTKPWLNRNFYLLKRSANRRAIYFNLNKAQFLSIYKIGKCHYCDVELSPDIIFSIDRKDNSVGYILDNCALCCLYCNYFKSNKFSESEMIMFGKVIKIIRCNRKLNL